MTEAIQFRKPRTVTKLSSLFGIPKGTHGRGEYEPKAIILHSLRLTLDSYYAQVTHPEYLLYRNRAQPIHPSLHYGIGYNGEVHQYVQDLDVAWGCFDYQVNNFPEVFVEGSFAWLTTYPDVTPDMYCLHIGNMSGEVAGQIGPELRTTIPMTPAAILTHARLIAWLCNLYEIECNDTNIVLHEEVDLQFVNRCIGDSLYPYDEILEQAQAIIAAGGEHDVVFTPDPTIDEFLGPFTVSVSRVSSAAYISND